MSRVATAGESLARLREELEAQNPSFRAATSVEARAEALCDSVRQGLRKQRKRRGLDQAALAKLLDYNQSTISKIENGRGDISLKTLYRIADALGMHPVVAFVPSADTADDPELATVAVAVEAAQEAMVRTLPDMMVDAMRVARAANLKAE